MKLFNYLSFKLAFRIENGMNCQLQDNLQIIVILDTSYVKY